MDDTAERDDQPLARQRWHREVRDVRDRRDFEFGDIPEALELPPCQLHDHRIHRFQRLELLTKLIRGAGRLILLVGERAA